MPQGDWLYDNSANKFNNTYFRDYNNTGFAVDMSGDLVIRGNVGIGTSSPTEALEVVGNVILAKPDASDIYIKGTSGVLHLESEYSLNITSDWNNNNPNYPADIIFNTGDSQRMIIQRTNGNVGIGTSSPDELLDLNGKFKIKTWRMYMDGTNNLVYTYNNSPAGYLLNNAGHNQINFTGQHRTFVENILHVDASNNQGLIVCANKNTYISMSNKIEKGNRAITQNETLPLVSLCTKSKDKSCFGVISESEDPDERADRFGNFVTPFEKEIGDTRIYINSVGEGAIWVSNKNGSLESGDYITTSDIPGYGEKQDSEFLANYTVAKITMDCDFNPQLQPKEIILKEAAVDDSGNNIYKNVLDANGEIQWTPELDSDGNVVQEYAYNLRYLDLQGTRLTKAEYDTKLANGEQVYIAAYVGCTYHCG